MIAHEANRMSISSIILDPSPDCPASVETKEQIVADFKDDSAILELAKRCNVITYEIELASSNALMRLESEGFPVHPGPKVLSVIQDKFEQKTFLSEQRIPVPRFALVRSREDLSNLCNEFGFPVILKACRDSYDGRGNFVIDSPAAVNEAYDCFSGRQSMVEECIRFSKEVSIMVARNASGQVESFPLVENIHQDGILHTTIVPARVNNQIQMRAKKLAKRIVESINGIGIFGIEMFLTKQGKLLINEIAPRPHNSGHYSNDACSISQFEQHVRAILNLPLVRPKLLKPAVMMNILGPDGFGGNYGINGLSKALSIPCARLYVYGKKTSKPRRKLGHITATADTAKEALARARKFRSLVNIVSENEEEQSS
jgi:5-(carboxyamino)imidazole ribonucleotide synthase